MNRVKFCFAGVFGSDQSVKTVKIMMTQQYFMIDGDQN